MTEPAVYSKEVVAEALAILKETRDLLTTKAHWTQLAFARDRTGKSVDPLSFTAYSFCAHGAITRRIAEHSYLPGMMFVGDKVWSVFEKLLGKEARGGAMQNSLIGYNDGCVKNGAGEPTGYLDVLQLLDAAVSVTEAEVNNGT